MNFWRPAGGRRFGAISAGEPFFFKSHHPHNRIVGGGFYSDFAALRISEAWELFGEGNGALSLEEMRRRVGRYRRQPLGPREDPLIGCVFVRDTRFCTEGADVEPPPDFAPSVVQGKSYALAEPRWNQYFGDLLRRVLDTDTDLDIASPWHRDGPVYGDPRLAPQRLGQQAFQAVVLGAYHRRCSATRPPSLAATRTSGRPGWPAKSSPASTAAPSGSSGPTPPARPASAPPPAKTPPKRVRRSPSRASAAATAFALPGHEASEQRKFCSAPCAYQSGKRGKGGRRKSHPGSGQGACSRAGSRLRPRRSPPSRPRPGPLGGR